ncbi:MAG TPA: acetyl-CoA carboxylase carboxyl transferase subunit beta, partial [Terriglobales bacterium]|nr:acetyl-CoA carboxylase carboxyl transferase subunit beta [Terriglobales bacterium]
MSWFKRESADLDTSGERKVKTEGLWVKCEGCHKVIWKKDLDANFNVCTQCGKHFRIDAKTRLAQLFDGGVYQIYEDDAKLASTDPLKFTDLKPYAGRLKKTQAETGLKDAIINARGLL